MTRQLKLGLGLFLVLAGILASEVGLYFLNKNVQEELIALATGIAKPGNIFTTEFASSSRKWIRFLQANGVISLIGLGILLTELRDSGVESVRSRPESLTKSLETNRR